ncbi:MAG: aldo/keto reductase [Acetobacteraceae bacterium]
MRMRRLGRDGPEVGAGGLGCMAMSGLYGPADDSDGLGTIRAALDAGVNLLDTADRYGMGHNELVLREARRGGVRRPAVTSVKFGALRAPEGAGAASTAGRSPCASGLTRPAFQSSTL